MAIYSLHLSVVSRGKGQSILAKAAYVSGTRLLSPLGEIHDFTQKRGVEFSGIVLPRGIPAINRQDLWQAAQRAERRKDACEGRECRVALPAELSQNQRLALVRELANYLVREHGVACDLALHSPSKAGDQRNWHAHLLLSSRRLECNVGAWQFTTKTQEWDDRHQFRQSLSDLRQQWEQLVNHALERAGLDARVSAGRSPDGLAQVHLGPTATALERRGVSTARGTYNRQIKALRQVRTTANVLAFSPQALEQYRPTPPPRALPPDVLETYRDRLDRLWRLGSMPRNLRPGKKHRGPKARPGDPAYLVGLLLGLLLSTPARLALGAVALAQARTLGRETKHATSAREAAQILGKAVVLRVGEKAGGVITGKVAIGRHQFAVLTLSNGSQILTPWLSRMNSLMGQDIFVSRYLSKERKPVSYVREFRLWAQEQAQRAGPWKSVPRKSSSKIER